MTKLKVFAWLFLMDRLNSRGLMLRKHQHLEPGPNCVRCSEGIIETRNHIFFECSFVARCWNFAEVTWLPGLSLFHSFHATKASFQSSCFIEIITCVAWNIQKERNGLIFSKQDQYFLLGKLGSYLISTSLLIVSSKPRSKSLKLGSIASGLGSFFFCCSLGFLAIQFPTELLALLTYM